MVAPETSGSTERDALVSWAVSHRIYIPADHHIEVALPIPIVRAHAHLPHDAPPV